MDPVSQAPAAPFLHTLPLFAGLSPDDALLLTEGLTTVEEVTSVVSVED